MKVRSEIIVKNLDKATRLNSYCETSVSLFESRKSVKKAIKKGLVLLNDERMAGGTWLKINDKITILEAEETPPKAYHLKVAVIYEDAHIAIINKPAGLTVSGNQFKTLVNALPYNLKKSNLANRLPWPLPVHRLDNQTSGLVVIAKTKTAQINLGNMFATQQIQKTYFAIIMGQLDQETIRKGSFSNPIDNKKAITNFKFISKGRSLKNDWLTLVKLFPKTGRTHQLRIHLSNNETPILGDRLYSKATIRHKGLFLTATSLEFKHPVTDKLLNISIPLPSKFQKRLDSEQKRWEKYYL